MSDEQIRATLRRITTDPGSYLTDDERREVARALLAGIETKITTPGLSRAKWAFSSPEAWEAFRERALAIVPLESRDEFVERFSRCETVVTINPKEPQGFVTRWLTTEQDHVSCEACSKTVPYEEALHDEEGIAICPPCACDCSGCRCGAHCLESCSSGRGVVCTASPS